MKIKALIPVRSGSTRVPNKNIRPFADATLLDIKIQQLLKVPLLDGIVVNSNDDEMLKIASQYERVELVKRDQKFATNTVSMTDVFQDMAEHFPGDVIVYCAVTYPLLGTETIGKIVAKYIEGAHDSVAPVSRVRQFLYKENKPLNFDPMHFPRSQDLPDIVALHWGAPVIARELMVERKNPVGANPFLYELTEEEALDIDTPFDFEIAEQLYRKKFAA
ncbi:MAG: acylneuraminate cytidylyltransferase family protein [Parcubacteria group bacterium]|nr:acylneuraminate cytidylyltransferase family protein [Parcubacteria group bacterium]